MSNRSTLLLEHHLKELRLPSFLREYGKMAALCAAENADHPEYLLRLAELETHRPPPAHGGAAHPRGEIPCGEEPGHLRLPGNPLGEQGLGDELARCEYVQSRENVIAVGNSGTGKTHVALGLGLAACPERQVRGLHHRRSTGPRAHGGQR